MKLSIAQASSYEMDGAKVSWRGKKIFLQLLLEQNCSKIIQEFQLKRYLICQNLSIPLRL